MGDDKDSGEFPQRFGKFLLLERVAVGGMAEVLLAIEQTRHCGRRFVILKRIRAEYQGDADYVEFFLTEGRVAAQCAHSHLPQSYELDAVDGVHFLSMEVIRGHNVLQIVNAAASRGVSISLHAAMSIAIGVAAALEHLHGLCDVDGKPMRIVHRDVSPQNVMVSEDGTVKLIDLGIARSDLQPNRTKTGIVKGKFSYLAPEVFDDNRSFDQRADLFALGIVLYETLTATSLFHNKDLFDRLEHTEAPDVRRVRADVPAPIAEVIMRALAHDPDDRYQTASEMLGALEHAVQACGVHTSIIALRSEVSRVCGKPAMPKVHPQVVAKLRSAADRAAGPPEAGPYPPVRDQALAYFVDKSYSSNAPVPTLPDEDPNFSRLLSQLES